MNLDDTFFEMSEKMALAYHSCISDKIAYRRMMHIAYQSPNVNVLCTNMWTLSCFELCAQSNCANSRPNQSTFNFHQLDLCPSTLLPLNCPPFHLLLQQLRRPPTLNPSSLLHLLSTIQACSEFLQRATLVPLQISFLTWFMSPKRTVQLYSAFLPEQSALLKKLLLLVAFPREFLCSILASSPASGSKNGATGKREFLIMKIH